MKYYVGILKDKNEALLTEALLREHVDHLKALRAEGLLQLCGPLTGRGQAMQLLRSDDAEAAKARFLQDPMLRDNFYAGYDFWELTEACDANNYLMDDTLRGLRAEQE